MYYEQNGGVVLKESDSFDVKQTLECGQCFRFAHLGDSSCRIVARGRVLDITQRNDEIFFSPCGINEFENIWTDYFDLKRDYANIKTILAEDDEVMKKAIEFGGGIRILNQDRWETLFSFIVSQNKRIPGIKKIIGDVSAAYGEKIEGYDEFAFPGPDRLKDATLDDLLKLKTGFRAKYLIDAIDKVVRGELDLYGMDDFGTEAIREELTRIKGVGPKVANCALLFSFGRRESFPVDTWIKKAMEHFYFNGEPTPASAIQKFAAEKFGELGGYAQQYLFYYMRETGGK